MKNGTVIKRVRTMDLVRINGEEEKLKMKN